MLSLEHYCHSIIVFVGNKVSPRMKRRGGQKQKAKKNIFGYMPTPEFQGIPRKYFWKRCVESNLFFPNLFFPFQLGSNRRPRLRFAKLRRRKFLIKVDFHRRRYQAKGAVIWGGGKEKERRRFLLLSLFLPPPPSGGRETVLSQIYSNAVRTQAPSKEERGPFRLVIDCSEGGW